MQPSTPEGSRQAAIPIRIDVDSEVDEDPVTTGRRNHRTLLKSTAEMAGKGVQALRLKLN